MIGGKITRGFNENTKALGEGGGGQKHIFKKIIPRGKTQLEAVFQILRQKFKSGILRQATNPKIALSQAAFPLFPTLTHSVCSSFILEIIQC
jgi:hypothetical protein